jgi:WD40 repeat protein
VGEWALSADPAAPAGVSERIGDYEIIEELGRGGMGCVYAARQIGLGRIVALKVVFTGLGTRADLPLRFLREAQTLAKLRHPFIVAVHDYGHAEGRTFLSMDYVEAGDLAHRLRAEPLTPVESARLAMKIAQALAYTHGMGVLHRDLKPSNILMDGDDPRVGDFGLAAQLESGGDLTMATSLIGTPHYLAPEALKRGSAAASTGSDIYSLGIILFEMLTGRTPYAGASAAEYPGLVATVEPPSPRLLAPAVPRDLETICLKCLERNPDRRYTTAAALAEDLQRFLEGRPIVARPVSALERFARWCGRRPALAAVWLLLVVIAFGASAAAVWIGHERSRAEAALRVAEVAEARAVRSTDAPGRRLQGLSALAAAARIRPGIDLRNEALDTLVTPDAAPVESWSLGTDQVVLAFSDGDGTVGARIGINAMGTERLAAELHRWGHPEPLQRLDVPGTRSVGGLRFDRGGHLVMARYLDQTLRVWRVGEPRALLTLHRPLPSPEMLTVPFNDDYDFGPDQKWLALGLPQPGGLSINRLPDGAELARSVGHSAYTTLRVSPDGRYVAAADGSAAHTPYHLDIVATPECRLVRTLALGAPAINLTWSADSRMVAVALADRSIALYDRLDGRLLQTLRPGVSDLAAIGFVSESDFVVSRGIGTSIRVTLPALPSHSLVIDGAGSGENPTDPTRDTFVLPSADGTLTRWRLIPPVGFVVMPAPRAAGYQFGFGAAGLDYSPDGRWLASAHMRYTVVRDSERGRLGVEIDSGLDGTRDLGSVIFGADGLALICCSEAAGLRRYSLRPDPAGGLAAGPAEMLDAERGFELSARTEDRRRILLVDQEHGRVKVEELAAGKARLIGNWSVPGVYTGAFGPGGDQILVNCSGQGPNASVQRLRVYRADGTVVRELPAPVSCDAAWSADGSVALTSDGNHDSVIWNTADWTPRVKLAGALGGNITTFALSPDGSYAVIENDRALNLVSTRDGKAYATLNVPESSGLSATIRFAPDGKRIAMLWNEGRVDVIDPAALRAALGKIGLAW